MTEPKEFFTIMEMADKLRIHPNTVRKAIKEGRIQAFRTGSGMRSEYRIPITEINRISEMDMSKLIEQMIDRKLEERNARPR